MSDEETPDSKIATSVLSDPAKLFEGRDAKGRAIAGQSLNPKGRPRGARNKLAENFLGDLLEVWEEQGLAAVRRAAFTDPVKFVDIIARLLPAKLEIKEISALDERLGEMSDETMLRILDALDRKHAAEDARIIDVTPQKDASNEG